MFGCLQRSFIRRVPVGYQRTLRTTTVVCASPMWRHQDNVPRFPLPALNDTLDRFLQVLKPLLTPEEHSAYAKKVEEFRHKEGPWLHKKLEVFVFVSALTSVRTWTKMLQTTGLKVFGLPCI